MSDFEFSADYVERFYNAVKSGIDLAAYVSYVNHLYTDILNLPEGERRSEAYRLLFEIRKGGYVIQTDNTLVGREKFVLPAIKALLDFAKKKGWADDNH